MQDDQHTPLDPLSPELEQLSQIAKQLPKPHPSPSTLWRWQQGVNGTKLHTLKIAGRVYTTREEFRRFIVAIQEPQESGTRESSEKVESELAKRGYLKPKGCR